MKLIFDARDGKEFHALFELVDALRDALFAIDKRSLRCLILLVPLVKVALGETLLSDNEGAEPLNRQILA